MGPQKTTSSEQPLRKIGRPGKTMHQNQNTAILPRKTSHPRRPLLTKLQRKSASMSFWSFEHRYLQSCAATAPSRDESHAGNFTVDRGGVNTALVQPNVWRTTPATAWAKVKFPEASANETAERTNTIQTHPLLIVLTQGSSANN